MWYSCKSYSKFGRFKTFWTAELRAECWDGKFQRRIGWSKPGSGPSELPKPTNTDTGFVYPYSIVRSQSKRHRSHKVTTSLSLSLCICCWMSMGAANSSFSFQTPSLSPSSPHHPYPPKVKNQKRSSFHTPSLAFSLPPSLLKSWESWDRVRVRV